MYLMLKILLGMVNGHITRREGDGTREVTKWMVEDIAGMVIPTEDNLPSSHKSSPLVLSP